MAQTLPAAAHIAKQQVMLSGAVSTTLCSERALRYEHCLNYMACVDVLNGSEQCAPLKTGSVRYLYVTATGGSAERGSRSAAGALCPPPSRREAQCASTL